MNLKCANETHLLILVLSPLRARTGFADLEKQSKILIHRRRKNYATLND